LDEAQNEKPIQEYLESHPSLVIGELGLQCHWVIPKKRLGSEFVTDFVVARLNSMGVKWTFIELQSPKAAPYILRGKRLGYHFNEGFSQISEWRRWLQSNLDYARREPTKNGLGLKDIVPSSDGLILIGREAHRDERTQAALTQFKFANNIEVRSYDYLAREAEKRINFRANYSELGECNCY